MSITTLALILLIPILVWRVYQRLKAQMARQIGRAHVWTPVT